MLDRHKIDEEFKISNQNKLKKQTQLETKKNLIVIIVLVVMHVSQSTGRLISGNSTNTSGAYSYFLHMKRTTLEPRFNKVARDRLNLFVKSRVRYIENLEITNLRENDQYVVIARYS